MIQICVGKILHKSLQVKLIEYCYRRGVPHFLLVVESVSARQKHHVHPEERAMKEQRTITPIGKVRLSSEKHWLSDCPTVSSVAA